MCIRDSFKPEQIKSALYYYFFDYSDITIKAGLNDMLNPEMSFIKDIIMNENLEDLRYLYFFGEYVTENEINIAKYLNSLSQDKIDSIARTFTPVSYTHLDVYKRQVLMTCLKLSVPPSLPPDYCTANLLMRLLFLYILNV